MPPLIRAMKTQPVVRCSYPDPSLPKAHASSFVTPLHLPLSAALGSFNLIIKLARCQLLLAFLVSTTVTGVGTPAFFGRDSFRRNRVAPTTPAIHHLRQTDCDDVVSFSGRMGLARHPVPGQRSRSGIRFLVLSNDWAHVRLGL